MGAVSVMTTWTPGRPGLRDGSGGLLPPPTGLFNPPAYVFDSQTARQIPGVARALQLYGGMTKQMPMDAYRGRQPLPRPRICSRPDPDNARSWFVQVSVEDYLLNGNAISLVTSRGADGWPLTVAWLPATWTYISWMPPDFGSVQYTFRGAVLPYDDVIHIKRGADRFYPVRGVGVVEEFLMSLDRVAMEEQYERNALAGGAVPSVAVISPSANLTPDQAKEAKENWNSIFGGPVREPAIVPFGTQIVPIGWSPSDTQLIEARHMSLIDISNIFNLDAYWLSSPGSSLTYKTAGPQYQQILRTSIEPVIVDFEDVWSNAWLPRGTTIRFDRNQLLRDDLPTTATALATLVAAQILTPAQAADYLALPSAGGGDPTQIQPVPEQVPIDSGQPQPGDQGVP